MSLIFLVIMGVYSLYANGYGVLVGAHEEPTQDGKMVLKRCSYFTGRETVISHIMRAANDKRGKPSCELVKKVYLDQTQPQQPQLQRIPEIELKPGSAPEPKAPAEPEPKKEP
jgi:hypothetical protein